MALLEWTCDGAHKCGQMELGNKIAPRCELYNDAIRALRRSTVVDVDHYPAWWEEVGRGRSSQSGQLPKYAQPRNLVLGGELISPEPKTQYIAVSYVWDPQSTWQECQGRRVTTQALRIAERLSKCTDLPLWIDAICIPQYEEEIKMIELAKMADIYRGAQAVICLVPELSTEICRSVKLGAVVMDSPAYAALQKSGDTYGSFLFVTCGNTSSKTFERLYGSRWWERAWTFQEAVLNKATLLVGECEESIPIKDVFKISTAVQKWAAVISGLHTTFLGRGPPFWESIATMGVATEKPLNVGQAISCVWRRQATNRHDLVYSLLGVCRQERVKPNYRLQFNDVLIQLFDSASASGDYSWLIWCKEITPSNCAEEVAIVPTPETVLCSPFMGISVWESSSVPSKNPSEGAPRGVMIPFRSTGVVRFRSPSMSLNEAVAALKARAFKTDQIWDMLFGVGVGLAADINREINNSDISAPLLSCAQGMIDGSIKVEMSNLNLSSERPFTQGINFTNFSAMAASRWKDGDRLVILSSQGGTTVVSNSLVPRSDSLRLYRLPVECNIAKSRKLIFVAYDDTRFRASAIGVLIEPEPLSGIGSWQLRRIA